MSEKKEPKWDKKKFNSISGSNRLENTFFHFFFAQADVHSSVVSLLFSFKSDQECIISRNFSKNTTTHGKETSTSCGMSLALFHKYIISRQNSSNGTNEISTHFFDLLDFGTILSDDTSR